MKIVAEGWYNVTCIECDGEQIGKNGIMSRSLIFKINSVGKFHSRDIFFRFFRTAKSHKNYEKIEDIRNGLLQTFSVVLDEDITKPEQIVGKTLMAKIKHIRVPTFVKNKKAFAAYTKIVNFKSAEYKH